MNSTRQHDHETARPAPRLRVRAGVRAGWTQDHDYAHDWAVALYGSGPDFNDKHN